MHSKLYRKSALCDQYIFCVRFSLQFLCKSRGAKYARILCTLFANFFQLGAQNTCKIYIYCRYFVVLIFKTHKPWNHLVFIQFHKVSDKNLHKLQVLLKYSVFFLIGPNHKTVTRLWGHSMTTHTPHKFVVIDYYNILQVHSLLPDKIQKLNFNPQLLLIFYIRGQKLQLFAPFSYLSDHNGDSRFTCYFNSICVAVCLRFI